MFKIILCSLAVILINFNYAFAEVTFSAFTKDGKALNDELSILNKKDKFRIIFFSDSKSEFDLTIKSKNEILNKQKVQISQQITLPGNEKWFQLGKTNDLSVILSNDDTNLELNYKIIPLHSVKEFNINKMTLTGEENELEINYVPDSENFKLEDKTITFDSLVVRGGSDIFRKYSSSVVLISTDEGQGTGFLVRKDAILTNWHVIKGYQSVGVIFKPKGFNKVSFKKKYIADVILTDQQKDIALLILRKDKISVTPLSFPKSNDTDVGDEVHAIGHPIGEYWSYNKGHISQLRPDYSWEIDGSAFNANIIQHQTPINPGNSGGPLLNQKGEVVGMNTFISPDAQGINYAVAAVDIAGFLHNFKNVSNRTVKESKVAKTEMADIDNDGIADGEVFDSDGNGTLDTFFEEDVKRNLKIYHIDKNGNGITEMMVVTTYNKNGGQMAVIYKDHDEDGKFDTRGYDYDYDGKIDEEERI